MTVKERKIREKERFKGEVLRVAYDLLKEGGLEGLTLRKLATGLEYSTTKLYHEFGGKQELIGLLAEDICERQNRRIEKIKKDADPEKHLLRVTREASVFYTEEPWSAGILAIVRFGGENIPMPPAFIEAAKRFRSCVDALNIPALKSGAALDEGLNVTRALMLGALSILHPDSSEKEKLLVIKIIDDGMRLIIAGWRSL
ncbi:MAG: TetR/AcrR family transcriptional regulator [Verrucomicrobia bacterium]|nr:TetR/AcrR family transcriptional regulator [Verrucomicrobiota bacterium]